RTGELLHFERESLHPCGTVTGRSGPDEIKREGSAQEVEDPAVRAHPLGARRGERVLDDRTIFRRRSGGGYVGAIDGEMQNEQLQRRAQAGGGIIPGAKGA